MTTLIKTTTGTINQMTLAPCGNHAGRFQDVAFELLSELCSLPDMYDNEWCDLMRDNEGNVYAIWAEDSLSCNDAKCLYARLERAI